MSEFPWYKCLCGQRFSSHNPHYRTCAAVAEALAELGLTPEPTHPPPRIQEGADAGQEKSDD